MTRTLTLWGLTDKAGELCTTNGLLPRLFEGAVRASQFTNADWPTVVPVTLKWEDSQGAPDATD